MSQGLCYNLSQKKQGVILTVTSRKEEHLWLWFRVRLTEEEQRVV